MKNMLLILLLCGGASLASFGQSDEVPAPVLRAFEKQVAAPRAVEWEYDEEDRLWEAEYKVGRTAYTSAFEATGRWVETEREIRRTALPRAVRDLLNSDFAGYRIDEAEWVGTPAGEYYEIELKPRKDHRGKELELQVSAGGQVLKQEVEEEEEEELK